MTDQIGQQFGDYRLLRALKQGGQASVYLGQHVRLQQKLAAVKLLQAQLSLDDIDAFQREADTIAELQHPHIVNILDFDVKQDIPFLIMDYYPAGTLHERHPRGQQVPLPIIVSYVKQIAEALQYAHDHRVVHRDVKPANMLIGRQGEIVLSDFGIVAVAHSTSSMRAQSFAGTVPYMAPEQIKQYPRRESDQYALAIVVYEWLSGELPFNGTPEEIAVKHLAAEPLSLCDRLPDLTPQVEQVVFKALAKDPKERFTTVQDFATALEQAMQETLPSSTPWATLPYEESAFSQQLPHDTQQEAQLVPPSRKLHLTTEIVSPVHSGGQSSIRALSIESINTTQRIVKLQRLVVINGKDVLKRIGREDTPSSWRVLLPARRKIMMSNIWNGLEFALFGVMMVYVMLQWICELFPPPPYPVLNASLSPEQVTAAMAQWGQATNAYLYVLFLGVPALVAVVFGFIAAQLDRRVKTNLVLVLLPEGLVYGRRDQQKASQVINYEEVTALRTGRKKVKVKLLKKTGGTRGTELDLSLFESSRNVAQSISEAYANYKQAQDS
ncbi:MAG: serine/threonine protein kinase [Chloroflexi bacterium]|nr:serine/threonine protein kinase [Chloroflexota bacterium]